MDDENKKDEPKVQADDNSIAVGGINISGGLSGNITIGNTGYTSDEVSALITQIMSTFRPKPFDGRCPYKGLDVFEEEDAELFFGREKLVDDLVNRVKDSRTVFVTGPSGSGKSSLVRAGLIHALKQGVIKASEHWLYATMKPGRDPIGELGRVVSSLAGSTNPEDEIRTKATGDATIFARWCEIALKEGRDKRVVLFIDQFEEVFTQISNEAERVAFLNLLTNAATVENGRVIILFSMRSDFVSNCATYPQLNELLSKQFRQIGAMQPEELVSAIAQPALRVGLRIDPDLIAQIINEMKGEPGALPLMQFALKDLFDSQGEKNGVIALTLNDYLQRGGIHKALERHADDSFSKLSKNEQELARSIFSGLIEIGRGTQDTKRTALFDELVPANTNAADIEAIVQKLADARLITTDEQAGRDTVTISHEKLIDAWPWLKKLVNENRDVIALQNEIASDAKEWDEHKREPSYLYIGARLINAREQMEAKKLSLSELSQEFVLRGGTRQRRRQMALLSGVSGIIVLLVFAVIVFNNQANTNANLAQRNEEIANTAQAANTEAVAQRNDAISAQATSQANFEISRSGELASQALVNLENKPELSLLLSVEAFNIMDTYQTRNALLSAITTFPYIHRYWEPLGYDNFGFIAFSEDGNLIAEMATDQIYISQRDSGEILHRLGFPGGFFYGSIKNITFSGDGTKVAASGIVKSNSESVVVWDLKTDQVISFMDDVLPISHPTQGVLDRYWQNIALNWNGNIIAIPTCSQFDEKKNLCMLGQIELRDTSTGLPIREPLYIHHNPSFYLAFVPNKDELFTVSCTTLPDCEQAEAIFVDTVTGKQILKTLPAMPLPFGILPEGIISYYEDEKTTSNPFIDRELILWDVASEEEKGRYRISKEHEFAGIASAGEKIAVIIFGSIDGYMTRVILDDQNQTVTEVRVINSPDAISWAYVDHTGNYFVARRTGFSRADLNPDVFILGSFDLANLGRPLAINTDQILAVAYDPDGKTFVTSICESWNKSNRCNKGELALWGTESLKIIKKFRNINSPILKIVFSKNGSFVACLDAEGNISIRDTKSFNIYKFIAGVPPKEGSLLAVTRIIAFSPDEKILAETRDGSLTLWDITNPGSEASKSEFQLANLDFSIAGISFSNNGKLLAVSGDSGISIWDLYENKNISYLFGTHSGHPRNIEFSPDNKYLVIENWDGTVQFWDSSDYSKAWQPEDKDKFLHIGHALRFINYKNSFYNLITDLSFNPDSSLLFIESVDSTVSTNNKITIVDINTQRVVGYSIPIARFGMSLNKDGKTMLTPGYIWDLDPQSWAQTACQIAGRNLTRIEWAQFFLANSDYRKTCEQWPLEEKLEIEPLNTPGPSPTPEPSPTPGPSPTPCPGGMSSSSSGLININIATLCELDSLPGIGPTMAQKIIDYRNQNGPFSTIEDIVNVSGIGPITFEAIKDLITVSSSETESPPTPSPTSTP